VPQRSIRSSLFLAICSLIIGVCPGDSYADERPRNVTVALSFPTVMRNPAGRFDYDRLRVQIYFGSDGTAYANMGNSQGVVLPANLNSNTHQGIYDRGAGKILYTTEYLQISGPLSNFIVIFNNDSFANWASATTHVRTSFLLDITGQSCSIRSSTVSVSGENDPTGAAAAPGPKTCQILLGRHLS
jgi:hypothetical protein